MRLESLDDTRRLARILLERAPNGALLLLEGPLGAGKTALTQQLGLELGARAAISSPTYTLVHEYPTPQGLLVHMDAYRLSAPEALLELGLEDYPERARLVVVEWGGPLRARFPDALMLHLSLENGEREARLEPPETAGDGPK